MKQFLSWEGCCFQQLCIHINIAIFCYKTKPHAAVFLTLYMVSIYHFVVSTYIVKCSYYVVAIKSQCRLGYKLQKYKKLIILAFQV